MKVMKWSKKAAATADKKQVFFRLLQGKKNENDLLLALVDHAGKKIENGGLLYIDAQLGGFVLLNNVSDDCPLKLDVVDSVCLSRESEITTIGLDLQRHGKTRFPTEALEAFRDALKKAVEK